jgi:hypothetical protein
VLSLAAVTTSNPPKPVYNFALARVRLSSAGGDANPVQVFFRTFISQTTAALTCQLDGSRVEPPSAQTDPDNSKLVQASVGYRIYGALIDNNLNDPYLTPTPVSGGSPVSLPTILMGEHQCVVTEVIYAGAPIPSGANPATSEKISQRNLAISTVANPGLSASRVAMHTFEIEATPGAISAALPPDELLLAWSRAIPSGTYLNLHIPSWNAQDVVDLANRFYARHEAIDTHTVEIPGGGDRYMPIPGACAVRLASCPSSSHWGFARGKDSTCPCNRSPTVTVSPDHPHRRSKRSRWNGRMSCSHACPPTRRSERKIPERLTACLAACSTSAIVDRW